MDKPTMDDVRDWMENHGATLEEAVRAVGYVPQAVEEAAP